MAQVLSPTAARNPSTSFSFHKRNVFQQRLNPLRCLSCPVRAKPRRCPSMIGTFQGHQPRLRLASGTVPGESRQFDGALNRLHAAVREQRRAQSRQPTELFCQWALIFVVIQIGNVHQLCCLITNRLHDPGMRVPQRIHPQPGNKIEIALPFNVEEKRLCPGLAQMDIGCSLQQETALTFSDCSKLLTEVSILPDATPKASRPILVSRLRKKSYCKAVFGRERFLVVP